MEEEGNGFTSMSAGPSSSSSPSISQVNHLQDGEIEVVEENNHSLFQRLSVYISGLASSSREDLSSFLLVLLTFWFFASLTMIAGFYGSQKLPLGPYISCLVEANSLLVQSIEVREVNGPTQGVMLFAFSEPPPLNVEINWSETHDEIVQSGNHKEWPYFLNEGSKVDISYNIKSPVSAPVFLVIAKGNSNLLIWAEDPSRPNSTLSWNIIHGNGMIQQDISSSDFYYIALGNLNLEEVEVQLSFTMKAHVYNTSQACYRCSLSRDECSLQLSVTNKNVAVLTSPGPDQAKTYEDGYIKLSYGPRWITYFVSSCVITVILILTSRMCTMFDLIRRDQTHFRVRNTRSELFLPKDDDHSSWDSSYDSITHEEEELDKLLAVASLEGKQQKEGDNNIENLQSLCVVCFDASRDCFFLPCGHSAACFTCGKRIVEDAGDCPICHRKAKKVRQIINV